MIMIIIENFSKLAENGKQLLIDFNDLEYI